MTKGISLPTEEKRERLFLILYLLLFAAVAVSIACVQPLEDTLPMYTNPPDEHARLRIPMFIARYGTLPVGTEAEMVQMYHGIYAMRPSLGLYIMGLLLRLLISFGTDGFALVIAARMVNVTFGVCMAYVVYLLSKRLFARAEIRWLFCCMTMYLPQHLFMHTYVNNESMNLLSVAMMLYGITLLYQDGFTRRNCVLLAAAWIICLLTNMNAYGFVLCTGILFLLRFIEQTAGKRQFDKKSFLRFGLPVMLAVLVGAGWWFVRMYVLHDGDIFALRATEAYHRSFDALQIGNVTSSFGEAWELFLAHDGLRAFTSSFVALYGSMSLWPPSWYYDWYAAFLLAGLLLACPALFVNVKKSEARQKIFWLLIFSACVITFVLWMHYLLYTDFQPQARYVMPVVTPLFVFLARGWEWFADKLEGKRPFCYLPHAACAFPVLTLLYYVYRVAFRYYLNF